MKNKLNFRTCIILVISVLASAASISLRDVFKRADEAMYDEKKRQKSINNEC